MKTGVKTFCGYTHEDMDRVLDFMCGVEDSMELNSQQEKDFHVAINCITTVMNRMKVDRPIYFEDVPDIERR